MSFAQRLPLFKLNDDGIYILDIQSEVNYPNDGNQFCFSLEEKSYWFKHRNNCIISLINKFPPSGRILDIGGGNGFVSQRIQKEGYPISLLEPGEVGARNAKNIREIDEVINCTFEDAKFPNDYLDNVGLFDVLEHIEDDGEFLKRIWSVLKPNGYVYATLPAYNSIWSYSDDHAEHFRRYNKKKIKSLLGGSFSLQYFSYFFSALLFPTILFRTFPYRIGRKKKGVLSSDSEFGITGGILSNLISKVLDLELKYLQSGKNILVGTSCLCVLEKIDE